MTATYGLSLALGLAASWPAPALACLLATKAEAVAPERALDGDTLRLDDGREIRLAGVAAPKAPLGTAAADWPLEAAARAALERAVAGRVLEFRPAGRTPDRHGRLVGHLAAFDATNHAEIAAGLVALGFLRLSGEETARDCDATLAAEEARAADARLGLWGDPYYEVRDAANGAALVAEAGRFVVAEGRVASVRTAHGRVYVNFGARWRDALSLTLSEVALRKLGGFQRLGIESGVRLRVRGVVEARRGPTIAVTAAAQIARLDRARGAAR